MKGKMEIPGKFENIRKFYLREASKALLEKTLNDIFIWQTRVNALLLLQAPISMQLKIGRTFLQHYMVRV